MKLRALLAGSLVLFVICVGQAYAEPPIIEIGDESFTNLSLGQYVEVLVDPEGEMSAEEVLSKANEEKFVPGETESINFGFTQSVYWLKLRAHNNSKNERNWVLDTGYPIYDLIEVYQVNNGTPFRLYQTGNRFSFNTRDIDFVDYAFGLTLLPDEEQTYLMRVSSEVSVLMALKARSLRDFGKHICEKYIYLGFYFGIILVMMFYNFFLYVSVKDGNVHDLNYLYYVVFLLGMWFTQLSNHGVGFQFFWPDNIWWNTRSIMVLAAFSFIWGVRFSRSFLNSKVTTPVLDKIMRGMEWFSGATMVMGFFANNRVMAQMVNLMLMSLYVLLVAGIVSWSRGYRAARFYVFAWTIFLIALGIFALMNFGILELTTFTKNTYMAGSALEVMLLSLALADRINLLRREKAIAQQEAIHQQHVAQEVLVRAKEELEYKVDERTAELKKAKEHAEDATKLKDKFISLVSHDLRSPLGAIISMISFIDGSARFTFDEARRTDTLKKVKNTATGLTEMIDQLLNISRLQTGKLRPVKKPTEVRSLSGSYVDQLTELARLKGVTLVNDLPHEMYVIADPVLLGEVISNLISNAVKFCEEGDQITIYSSDGAGTICVKDTGVGVEPEALPFLFKHEVKTTTLGTGGEKGTGLGLPYCSEIINAHGGTLTVSSELGKGSEFRITLPSARPVVLIVDDQDVQRHMVREQLVKIADLDIYEAATGREALALLKDVIPVLIITDLEMPDMNGYELLASLRRNPLWKHTPVIVNTALGAVETVGDSDKQTPKEKAMALGATKVIFKPVVPENFVPIVKELLAPIIG